MSAMTSRMKPEQKKSNLRLALILASVAAIFFVGFIAKMVLLGR
jgi:hypothetical protein